MQKRILLVMLFFFVMGAAFGQGSPLPQMDAAIRGLAGDANRRLNEERVRRIAVTQFTYQNYISDLGSYWANQLIVELSRLPNKSYILLSDGPAGADWTISGEIVEAGDFIRVFTRLVRVEDRAIMASFNSDLQRNEYTMSMLYSDGRRDGARLSYVSPDTWEPDSWDNPASMAIGAEGNAASVERTLHNDGDEDYFLLAPERNGLLVMETTGDIDTIMYFYNAGTQEELAEDDDGGFDLNARISFWVQAGRRYVARVIGYAGNTGPYVFRAYITDSVGFLPR